MKISYRIIVILIIIVVLTFVLLLYYQESRRNKIQFENKKPPTTSLAPLNPLSIAGMRQKVYPGSNIVIEEKLVSGSNYDRYIASYQSEGLKIYALLTVPQGNKPKSGWPSVIFNHGYIPPEVYQTTERYLAYTDAFSRNGYIVFKPDFRGNGQSEGQPEGAYYSPAYTIDDLNAISSIKKYKDADPDKIGIWGHSMGGNIALRDLVIDPRGVKAAVIWGGVVGSYNDLINNWQRRVAYQPSPRELTLRNRNRQSIIKKFGTPESNPDFWKLVDPTFFVGDITAPVQLHHGLADDEVPVAFSQSLYEKLKQAKKTVEYYTYEGADHNISGSSFDIAMDRSVKFFDRYLK